MAQNARHVDRRGLLIREAFYAKRNAGRPIPPCDTESERAWRRKFIAARRRLNKLTRGIR